ncbi:hypothetical protein DASC09_062150 [Saccharomycopsis crataegensis]|uniref:F-box domain-containing protein n=1 Tax=Saccharomycopsis crataegensis TaxID=43959 RepID=A0AAV5QVZ4_9ASCO|nr:hypothetical protein DASC09_062150 [Saccharomycopsis crataegensis]
MYHIVGINSMGFLLPGKKINKIYQRKIREVRRLPNANRWSKENVKRQKLSKGNEAILINIVKKSVLERLPAEILLEIFSLLPVEDLEKVVLLNKYFFSALKNSVYLGCKIVDNYIHTLPKKKSTPEDPMVRILDITVLSYKFVNLRVLESVAFDTVLQKEKLGKCIEKGYISREKFIDFPERFYQESITADTIKLAEYLSESKNLRFFDSDRVFMNVWMNYQGDREQLFDTLVKCLKEKHISDAGPLILALQDQNFRLCDKIINLLSEESPKACADEVWQAANSEGNPDVLDYLLQTPFQPFMKFGF